MNFYDLFGKIKNNFWEEIVKIIIDIIVIVVEVGLGKMRFYRFKDK